MIPDFSVVLGLDQKHLQQLKLVIPTWKLYKPSLFEKRWIVFRDRNVEISEVVQLLNRYGIDNHGIVAWPPLGVEYTGDPSSKWENPQREKMLSGFVHVAAEYVKTPYWLKIDTDVIASGKDDWIEESWFEKKPVIISQRWAYTKPRMQMMDLEKWFDENYNVIMHGSGISNLTDNGPLNLVPKPESSLVSHSRIISWVGFFNTEFTKFCAKAAEHTCGVGKMPVPSQDGFVFYMAKRCGFGIERVNMKRKGWIQKNSMKNIQSAVEKVML